MKNPTLPALLLLIGLTACATAETYPDPTPWEAPVTSAEEAGGGADNGVIAPPGELPQPPEEPPEPVPARLGTPASSRAAAPAWWLADGHSAYAPSGSLGHLWRATAEAPSQAEQLSDGGLVCAFDVDGYLGDDVSAGSYAGTDLTVGVQIVHAAPPGDKTPLFYGAGPEDVGVATVFVPLIDLRRGDTIRANLIDRDVIVNDALETIAAPWDGALPFRFKGRIGRAECRFVPRAAIEQELGVARARADRAMQEAQTGAQIKTLQDIGSIPHLVRPARDAIAVMAALVGWDDPRVQRRLALTDALERRLRDAWLRLLHDPALGAVDARAQEAPILGGLGALQLARIECDPKAVKALQKIARRKEPVGCALYLRVRNSGSATLGLHPGGEVNSVAAFSLLHADFAQEELERALDLDARGKLVKAASVVKLAPGQEHTFVAFASRFDAAGLNVLRVGTRLSSVPLRSGLALGGLIQLGEPTLSCGGEPVAAAISHAGFFARGSTDGVACVLSLPVENISRGGLALSDFGGRAALGPLDALTLGFGAEAPTPLLLLAWDQGAGLEVIDHKSLPTGQRATLVLGIKGQGASGRPLADGWLGFKLLQREDVLLLEPPAAP